MNYELGLKPTTKAYYSQSSVSKGQHPEVGSGKSKAQNIEKSCEVEKTGMGFLKIGVTGSAGSGKSLVCRRFEEKGVATLDCDAIARQVVEPGAPGLGGVVDLFGKTVLQADGHLDRAMLRKRIISEPDAKQNLEALLHPMILSEMIKGMERARQEGYKAVAVEVPLLFETGMDRFFDVTLTVLAQDADLVSRICQRDQVSCEDASKMLALQMAQSKKAGRSDYVLQNTGSARGLYDSVDNLFEKFEKEGLTT